MADLPKELGPLLLLLALTPGWVYLQLLRRLRPRARSTALSELLEAVAVGLFTTGLATWAVISLRRPLRPFIVDVDGLIAGKVRIEHSLDTVARTVVLVLVLAVLIAGLLHGVQRLRRSPEFHPEGGLWVYAISDRPKGHIPYVGLQMKSGKLVEGALHSISLEDLGDDREIALTGTIRVTEHGQTGQVQLDRLVVPYREVEHVSVLLLKEKQMNDRSGMVRSFVQVRMLPLLSSVLAIAALLLIALLW
ncbi:DUF6338 family protein [Kribbella sp. NPDC051952]|uniref:DUF6338 family protein n=1 Tax=Kribbella sp. NPDC051952 TaxID=3154851 RepID=UPI0034418D61